MEWETVEKQVIFLLRSLLGHFYPGDQHNTKNSHIFSLILEQPINVELSQSY